MDNTDVYGQIHGHGKMGLNFGMKNQETWSAASRGEIRMERWKMEEGKKEQRAT